MSSDKPKNLHEILDDLGLGDIANDLLAQGLVRWDDMFVVSRRDSWGTGVSPVHTPPARRQPCPSKADCNNVRCYEDGYCRRTGEILQGDMT